MSHILLDIKYENIESILYDKSIGEKLIYNWCNYNNHDLVMPPISYVFPSVSVYKTNDSSINKKNDYNTNISQNYSLLNDYNDKIEYSGYTSIGILKESHISIHTYPELNSVQLDLFSCKMIDEDRNKLFVEKYLNKNNAIKFEFTFLKRKIN